MSILPVIILTILIFTVPSFLVLSIVWTYRYMFSKKKDEIVIKSKSQIKREAVQGSKVQSNENKGLHWMANTNIKEDEK